MSMSLEPVTVTLHDERDCAAVVKVRILRWEPVLDYLGGPDVRGEGGLRGEGGQQEVREGGLRMEAEVRVMGDQNQGRQAASGSWERRESGFSPRASRRNVVLPIHLDFGPPEL